MRIYKKRSNCSNKGLTVINLLIKKQTNFRKKKFFNLINNIITEIVLLI